MECSSSDFVNTLDRAMSDLPRSSSVLRKGSVVDHLFKLANHATTHDRLRADQKYQIMNDDAEGTSTKFPPVWEEEIFVTCASIGDVDDAGEEEHEETSIAGSIQILLGQEDSVVPRHKIRHFDPELLKDMDGFCTDNLGMFCISKDNVIDDSSQVNIDSFSWEQLVNGEKPKHPKKNRFGWLMASSKEEPPTELTLSDFSNASEHFTKFNKQAGVEMVLRGNGGATMCETQTSRSHKSEKGSSSWYPRLVRRTRMNKAIMKQAKHEAGSTGLLLEDIEGIHTEPLDLNFDPSNTTIDDVKTDVQNWKAEKDDIPENIVGNIAEEVNVESSRLLGNPETNQEKNSVSNCKEDIIEDEEIVVKENDDIVSEASSSRLSAKSSAKTRDFDNASVASVRSRISAVTVALDGSKSVSSRQCRLSKMSCPSGHIASKL
jgi:hypothetical protein